jgi:hypothetical protein
MQAYVHTTSFNHARNRDVRHQCVFQDRHVGESVNTRRTEWNEHMSQMASDRVLQIAMTVLLEGGGVTEYRTEKGETNTPEKSGPWLNED